MFHERFQSNFQKIIRDVGGISFHHIFPARKIYPHLYFPPPCDTSLWRGLGKIRISKVSYKLFKKLPMYHGFKAQLRINKKRKFLRFPENQNKWNDKKWHKKNQWEYKNTIIFINFSVEIFETTIESSKNSERLQNTKS